MNEEDVDNLIQEIEPSNIVTKKKYVVNKKYIIFACIPLLVAVITTIVIIYLSSRVDTTYMDYIENCYKNNIKDSGFYIHNTVENCGESTSFVETFETDYMYCEESVDNNTDSYELVTWTDKDGTTYSLYGDEWYKYPTEFNKTALSTKSLELELWCKIMTKAEKADKEQYSLGLESPVDVDMYNVEFDANKVSEVMQERYLTIYKGLVREYKEKNKNGEYTQIIKDYEEYIKQQKSSYTYSKAYGKVGVYNNKAVYFEYTLVGGGGTIKLTKIVSYADYQKRQVPEINKEDCKLLSDYVYTQVYSGESTQIEDSITEDDTQIDDSNSENTEDDTQTDDSNSENTEESASESPSASPSGE